MSLRMDQELRTSTGDIGRHRKQLVETPDHRHQMLRSLQLFPKEAGEVVRQSLSSVKCHSKYHGPRGGFGSAPVSACHRAAG